MRYDVRYSFGGDLVGSYVTFNEACEAAYAVSVTAPVDIWSTTGGMFGQGKVIAHVIANDLTYRS